MEFQEFPKMARLSRDVIVTEKIDGTNAQVLIHPMSSLPIVCADFIIAEKDGLALLAGSRTRYLTPTADNFGFAKWVKGNAADLFTLGAGRHFGEWWGHGVQRGYGLTEKRFSLFNVGRWALHGAEPQRVPMADPRIEKFQDVLPACVGLVPVVYRGTFESFMGHVDDVLKNLVLYGSLAAPGFMKPEGIVAFHVAANVGFKKTIEKDAEPKSRHLSTMPNGTQTHDAVPASA